MELAPGTIVTAVTAAGEDQEHTSRWEVLAPFQVTRLRSTWFARSAAPDFSDHRVLLTVCRYNPKLLGRREYVDNVRRRLMHEAEMLTVAHNALPEPVDLFVTHNDQDGFSFSEADRYRRTEPVLVTEALNGRPLDAWVSISGPFTEKRALKVARKIADLLGELHGKRILAYELRPEDLLVDPDDHDRVWVGSCANYQTMDPRGVVEPRDLVVPLSDFAFTAPEVEAGRAPLDVRSDVYSFGALLLFLLTGKRAPEVVGADGVVRIAGASPETCRLIGRCLAAPGSRMADTGELKVALDRALRVHALPARDPVVDLEVTLAARRLTVSWGLPPDWTDEDGLVLLRWRSGAKTPPDVGVWKVLAEEVPSRRTSWEERDPLGPGETWRYAVVRRRRVGEEHESSHPAVGAVEIPLTLGARLMRGLRSALGLNGGRSG